MNKPRVLIPLESWRNLMAYVDLVETEITGFFDVDYDPDQHAFVVGKIYLVDQEAGGADVEMDEDALTLANYEFIKQGRDQLPRGWWHSHVNMGVFFSGTDDQTINRDFSNDTFTVSIVVNKKRLSKASAVIWETPEDTLLNRVTEAKANLRIDDLEVVIKLDHESIPKSLEKEVSKKVKTRILAPSIWKSDKKDKQDKVKIQTKIDGKIPKMLPKDKQEALSRIEGLDLVRCWKTEINDFAFVDMDNGDIWLDIWQVVEWRDYIEIKGADDTDRSELQTTKVTKFSDLDRCVNCGFDRDYHSPDYCASEIYPDDLTN